MQADQSCNSLPYNQNRLQRVGGGKAISDDAGLVVHSQVFSIMKASVNRLPVWWAALRAGEGEAGGSGWRKREKQGKSADYEKKYIYMKESGKECKMDGWER